MSKNILLIDDDKDLIAALKRGFEKRGYSAYTAENKSSVSEVLQINRLEYVVLDLNLDGESGLDCIELLRQHNSDIKIVITTGYASISTAVNAIKQGATQYLAKPITIEDIIKAFNNENRPNKETLISHDIKVKEWEHIQDTLEKNKYNITETAKELGYHRRTLQRKLKKRHYSV